MTFRLEVVLDDETLERLAELMAERLARSLTRPGPEQESPWLYGQKAAAKYLGWPLRRVQGAMHQLPHRKHNGRTVFHRDELDDFVDGLDGRPGSVPQAFHAPRRPYG